MQLFQAFNLIMLLDTTCNHFAKDIQVLMVNLSHLHKNDYVASGVASL